MKICRFRSPTHPFARIGVSLDDVTLHDLESAGIQRLTDILDHPTPADFVRSILGKSLRTLPVTDVALLSPVENQEVWAAGVTYLRSKKARMEESDFSATAYDRVYEADRPEIFFKSMPAKVVGPGGQVGIRKDAKWNVPEPELALVLNKRHELVGYTIGNDMSSRDIEGENLLYLPQAKVYDGACAAGPWIVLGTSEADARQWSIEIQIVRGGVCQFEGSTSLSNIRRSFAELIEYLCRSQTFPQGALLLTGTGVVPPNDFTLAGGDEVTITVSGIGTLKNVVTIV
jgi:2-dehydro-3-deoxy-D-arabinonate dehydratase